MKKHFLSYIVIIFCFSLFFTELLLRAQEVPTSRLDKVTLKSSKGKVFLNLRGSFKELTEDAIFLVKESDGFVVELQKTLLGKARKKIKKSAKKQVSNIELTEVGEEEISRIKLVTSQNVEIYSQYQWSKQSSVVVKKKKVTIGLNFTEFVEIIETPPEKEEPSKTKTPTASDGVVESDSIQTAPIRGGITVSKVYKKPQRLNIIILHNRATKKKAYNLSSLLLRRKKSRIESSLDLKINVVSITQMPTENYGRNVIYFKNNHYLSAIYLSDLLKDVYVIMPVARESKKKEVDIEILISE